MFLLNVKSLQELLHIDLLEHFLKFLHCQSHVGLLLGQPVHITHKCLEHLLLAGLELLHQFRVLVYDLPANLRNLLLIGNLPQIVLADNLQWPPLLIRPYDHVLQHEMQQMVI